MKNLKIGALSESELARFKAKADRPGLTGCVNWLGTHRPQGYGVFAMKRGNKWQTYYSHRVAWIIAGRPLESGKVIDHLCRNRSCINPDHLELVLQSVNIGRGNHAASQARRAEKRTHCVHGHKYTKDNTYMCIKRNVRQCRECGRKRALARYHQKKEALNA